MKFKIPFTFSDTEILKRRSKKFFKFTPKKGSKLDSFLNNSGEKINKRQYLSITYRSFIINLSIFIVLFTTLFGLFAVRYFYFYGLILSFVISCFVFLIQFNYPKIFSLNKKRDIEKNLIPLLQDMIVQANSGVPVFDILINISNADYGEASKEFKKITNEINSGSPQIEAIEKYGKLNTSEYFNTTGLRNFV